MNPNAPVNEKGEPLFEWTDGKWYTVKAIRRLSFKRLGDSLSVRTLSRRGTEQTGRPCRDARTLGGSEDFTVADDE